MPVRLRPRAFCNSEKSELFFYLRVSAMINSTLCYIEHEGNYLLLHRIKKKNDINEGKWIGVGGKFEKGETADQCVLREVYEETGLTLTEFYQVGVIKFFSDQNMDQDMYLYKGTAFTGKLVEDCSEGVLKWVPAEDVLSLPTWEGDHLFLKPLLEGKKNLNMTVKYENDVLVEFIDESEDVVIEKSTIINSSHAFSTRIGGVSDGVYFSLNLGMNRGDSQARVTENWRRFLAAACIGNEEFVCGAQVHGNNVHIATEKDLRPAYGPGQLIEADGYVTACKNVPLAIFTADCVPLLMEDPVNGVIGAIHCGWRSTVGDIENEAIECFKKLGSKVSNIKAAIGPAIDRCCFEVGEEVIEAVNLLIGDSADSFYNKKENGKYMLDLRGVVKCRLVQLGVLSDNIEIVGGCTLCNPERYYSHRFSEGKRGSLACVIELQ